MKRAVIVHCWDGYPDYCWYPQTKKELEEKGFKVLIPEMPETNLPKLSLWLPKLQETIGQPDQNLFLIGHSSGCITIMRFLETLGANQKIGGVVFVAGFTDDLGFPELSNFFETPIDFEKVKLRVSTDAVSFPPRRKIKTKAHHFVAIQSDDDPYVPLKYGDILKQKLGAKLITKHQMGHFSGPVDNTTSCTSLPDVTQSILSMLP